MRRLVYAVAFATPTLGLAQSAPPGWSAFETYFDSVSRTARVVGGGAVLVEDGRIVARHNFGLADRALNQPVTDRSIFHYGSITKTLTAIGIMQLRDRGKLTLDDKIVRWIPELRQVHDPYGLRDSITIRMLLSHTSGFQGGTWPYGGEAWQPFEPTTWNQLVAMMPYQQLVFKPGSRFGYSNPGYVYLARVIEAITGDPWEAYVQKNLFTPLGLTRSYFNGTPYHLAGDRSNNYTIQRDSASGREDVHENGRDFNPGITIPNGGWNAPLDDLASYVAFLTNSTGGDPDKRRLFDAVLSRATLHEMWKPVVVTGTQQGIQSSVGLSYFLSDDGTTQVIGHTGSQAGFLSFLWVNPGTKTGIVVAINTNSAVRGTPSALGPIMAQAMKFVRPPAKSASPPN
jgi:CubicO group peptidase (beta-lactamase class C family)